jgi:predicted nucleotidyltransferase
MNPPTPCPEVDNLLEELLRGIRFLLGNRLVGLYLDGSLACGDFDAASDIDFLAVTEEEATEEEFSRLQAMHKRIAADTPRRGAELEGSYISRAAVRRYDPALAIHPNLERGKKAQLKMVRHDEDWRIHYHVVRERGMPLCGPDPKTLIDPVSPDDLRTAMLATLEKWWRPMLSDPAPLRRRGYQSYAVLTMCRICYTFSTGKVASKSDAALWAKADLDGRFVPLIDRAGQGRLQPDPATGSREITETQDFIRYALERSHRSGTPRKDAS